MPKEAKPKRKRTRKASGLQPLSKYHIFTALMRPHITRTMPAGSSFGDISKEMGACWNTVNVFNNDPEAKFPRNINLALIDAIKAVDNELLAFNKMLEEAHGITKTSPSPPIPSDEEEEVGED